MNYVDYIVALVLCVMLLFFGVKLISYGNLISMIQKGGKATRICSKCDAIIDFEANACPHCNELTGYSGKNSLSREYYLSYFMACICIIVSIWGAIGVFLHI